MSPVSSSLYHPLAGAPPGAGELERDDGHEHRAEQRDVGRRAALELLVEQCMEADQAEQGVVQPLQGLPAPTPEPPQRQVVRERQEEHEQERRRQPGMVGEAERIASEQEPPARPGGYE